MAGIFSGSPIPTDMKTGKIACWYSEWREYDSAFRELAERLERELEKVDV